MAGEGGHGLGSARPAKPRRLLPPARSPCPPRPASGPRGLPALLCPPPPHGCAKERPGVGTPSTRRKALPLGYRICFLGELLFF